MTTKITQLHITKAYKTGNNWVYDVYLNDKYLGILFNNIFTKSPILKMTKEIQHIINLKKWNCEPITLLTDSEGKK